MSDPRVNTMSNPVLTFGGFDGLKSGREELVELQIIHIRTKITHPNGMVLLSGHQTRGIVVQFESDRLQSVRIKRVIGLICKPSSPYKNGPIHHYLVLFKGSRRVRTRGFVLFVCM